MNIYLVIACGNYETKIMVGMIKEQNFRLLYIDEFLSNEMILDSELKNKDKFQEELFIRLEKIKKQIGIIPKKVILNIPTKKMETIFSTSLEYKLSKYLTIKKWNKICNNLTLNENQLKDNFLLGKKIFNWILDGVEYLEPPFNIQGQNLIFKTQYYITNNKYVEPFQDVFNRLKIKIDEIVVDPMIIPEGFHLNLRSNKALINIGHDKSNLFYYKNFSLNKQSIINFGLKDLTQEISKSTKVSEEVAIKFLKIYRNTISFENNNIPFKVSIQKNMGKYDSFNNENINLFIKDWLNKLNIEINNFYNELLKKNEEIDEIYILSATNIFEVWVNYLRAKLNSKIDVFYINEKNLKFNNEEIDIIGFHEPKYISLIYSLFYLHKQPIIEY